MKKTDTKSNCNVKTETIKPITPHQIDVVRTIDENGEAKYYHPLYGEKGEPLYIYSESVEDFVRSQFLNRTKSLIDNMGDDCYADFGYVFEALADMFDIQIEEIKGHLEAAGINVVFDLAGRGQIGYRCGQILGVRVHFDEPKRTQQ